MGKPTGFMEHERQLPAKRSAAERINDYKEFYKEDEFSDASRREQASRCMDCGIPFCHSGCPLGNLIPDFNDLVYRGNWQEALERLHATNNFPEFTGRLCPAPCEEACVVGISEPPVAIEFIEKSIVEHGFQQGWITPQPPEERTGKTVAVIGSGPAGLAAAQQLNRAGHKVTVFERADRIGGLLRYGIPDFKMEKWVIDRRVDIMKDEGINFRTSAHVGKNVTVDELDHYDAIVLCGGATKPRNLPIPGRELNGIHFAMDFLSQNNKRVAGDEVDGSIDDFRSHADTKFPGVLNAKGKNVIVIGGGDTGSDCIGTSLRHGAVQVDNFELFPKPPEGRPEHQPWPYYPMKLRTSTSHEEGCERAFSTMTKEFIDDGNGNVKALRTVEVKPVPREGGGLAFEELPGSEKIWPTELVLLAMGFTGPETNTMVEQLGLELDPRGNVKCGSDYQSSRKGVFCAGDMRRGQSLIVWAISEGREAAHHVDAFLRKGSSELPTKGGIDLPRV
jgi:glutamate synthase (NADPH/NADH) small chain